MMPKNKAHTLNTKIFLPSVMYVSLLKYINWEAYNNCAANNKASTTFKGVDLLRCPLCIGIYLLILKLNTDNEPPSELISPLVEV